MKEFIRTNGKTISLLCITTASLILGVLLGDKVNAFFYKKVCIEFIFAAGVIGVVIGAFFKKLFAGGEKVKVLVALAAYVSFMFTLGVITQDLLNYR